jgi:hypothetical protein
MFDMGGVVAPFGRRSAIAPIVVRTSRRLLIVALVVSVVFSLVCLLIAAREDASVRDRVYGSILLVFFVVFGLRTLLRMARPDRLELSSTGLKYSTAIGSVLDAPWAAIGPVEFTEYRGRKAWIGFDVAPPYKRKVRGRMASRALGRHDVLLPRDFEIGPTRLRHLINEERRRWG